METDRKNSYFCQMIRKEIPFVDIHTHRSGEGYDTYGVHPWKVSPQTDLSLLESLLKENRIVAIGETGLDRLHSATFDLQLKFFEQHILLSEQYQKPLIIHNVKATADLLRLFKKHQPKQSWIIHGFNGNTTEVQQLTSNGIFLSVGESIFYPNRKITTSIRSIPLDYLFLETDTSEKTIQQIYGKAAELLNLPIDTLKEIIFANFERLNLNLLKTGNNDPGCLSEPIAIVSPSL